MSKPMSTPEYIALSAANDSPLPHPPRNLAGVSEAVAEGEVANLYEHFREHFGRPQVPGILQCFATHPPLLQQMMDLAEYMIFGDGHLGRRVKEMIATLVSSRNHCPYCADSHGFFLKLHGGSAEALDSLLAGSVDTAAITESEQTLLRFATKVNENSQAISPTDISELRSAGWTEQQIAETIHVTALFATYNRVANAFGLESQGLLMLR